MNNGDVFGLRLSEEILVSLAVLGGYYGNGEERKKKLEQDGYNAERIQKCVDDLYKVFKKWGVKF